MTRGAKASPQDLGGELRTLLGLGPPDTGRRLPIASSDALMRHSRDELLAAGKRLSLRGLDRLPKREIVARLRDALELPRSLDTTEGAHVPWGYGQTRVTGMPVDPRRLFVYWEITDGAIAEARDRLGPGGPDAWLNLRVYDVTGRIFDGTNAHSYFDVRVERNDRQRFIPVDKPASQAIAEIGLKSLEGYFVKSARTGRVEFPRDQPVPPGGVEWLTVRGGAVDVAPSPAAAPPAPSPPRPGGGAVPVDEPVEIAGGGGAIVLREQINIPVATAWSWTEWCELFDTQWIESRRSFVWHVPMVRTTWEAGPFPVPVPVPVPVPAPLAVEERYEGTVSVESLGGATHIVYGPWQVVIRGIGGHASGRVVARWEMYQAWVVAAGVERVLGEQSRYRAAEGNGAPPGAGSEIVQLGASERRWLAGSEVRLLGASEIFLLGASELRLGGASERWLAAASERRLRGASEVRFAGASEVRLLGASERRFVGASEVRLGGASERAARLGSSTL